MKYPKHQINQFRQGRKGGETSNPQYIKVKLKVNPRHLIHVIQNLLAYRLSKKFIFEFVFNNYYQHL